MSQQETYCKRLKVMCPEHYKERKVSLYLNIIMSWKCETKCEQRTTKMIGKSQL